MSLTTGDYAGKKTSRAAWNKEELSKEEAGLNEEGIDIEAIEGKWDAIFDELQFDSESEDERGQEEVEEEGEVSSSEQEEQEEWGGSGMAGEDKRIVCNCWGFR